MQPLKLDLREEWGPMPLNKSTAPVRTMKVLEERGMEPKEPYLVDNERGQSRFAIPVPSVSPSSRHRKCQCPIKSLLRVSLQTDIRKQSKTSLTRGRHRIRLSGRAQSFFRTTTSVNSVNHPIDLDSEADPLEWHIRRS